MTTPTAPALTCCVFQQPPTQTREKRKKKTDRRRELRKRGGNEIPWLREMREITTPTVPAPIVLCIPNLTQTERTREEKRRRGRKGEEVGRMDTLCERNKRNDYTNNPCPHRAVYSQPALPRHPALATPGPDRFEIAFPGNVRVAS